MEDFGGIAERSDRPDMATTGRKPATAGAPRAARSCLQTREQVDGRRSGYFCRDATCGRCRVG